MIKLVSITFTNTPRLPGLRAGDMSTIQCERPDGSMRGWRVAIRGASVFFISPAGFVPGVSPMAWDKNKTPIVHEIPRSSCYFQWAGPQGSADFDAIVKNKYDSEPFGEPFEAPPEPEAPKGFLSQLDPSQMGDA